MHNLIQPSTSINHDDFSRACMEMKPISDVIACSGYVVNITSCSVRVSPLIGWLVAQEGVAMETMALSG